MSAIFISHSSADKVAAAQMKAWLEAEGHTSLFLDFDPLENLSDRNQAAIEPGPKERVRAAQFSPNGRLVAAGLDDGSIQLWDVGSGKRPPEIHQILLAADNRAIATVAADHVARLWYVFPSTQALIEYSQTIVRNQPLTAAERRRFFVD